MTFKSTWCCARISIRPALAPKIGRSNVFIPTVSGPKRETDNETEAVEPSGANLRPKRLHWPSRGASKNANAEALATKVRMGRAGSR